MLRKIVVTALAAVALTVPFAGSAVAAPTVPAPTGPECRPDVVTSVLVPLARNGTPVIPGQKIQYLQVMRRTDGSYVLELCTVTIPSQSAS